MPSAPSERARRVLLIDDSEDIRDAYGALLEAEHYEVATAANGEEGLAAVATFRPDVLIVDVVMPVMDGLEFLLHLRSDFAPPLPPVIMSSGFDAAEREAMARGAYAFVPKPASEQELLGLLERALADVPPDEEVLRRGRVITAEARSAAVRAAEASIAGTPFDRLLAGMGDLLGYLAGYFDADVAFAAVFRGGALTMISGPGHPRLTEAPASMGEIIATGSTLVLPDISKSPMFANDLRMLPDIRSLVGVPLLTSSFAAAGAICLGRLRVEPFTVEDVLLLQAGGRRTSHLLERVNDGAEDPFRDFPFVVTAGAFERGIFELLVEMELRLATHRCDAIELALLDLDAPLGHAGLKAIRDVVDASRWAIGALDPSRIAFLKRGPDPVDVARQIDAATAALEAIVPLRRVASITIAGACVGLVDVRMLFRLVERELELALAEARGGGTVARVTLEPGFSSPAPAAHAAHPP